MYLMTPRIQTRQLIFLCHHLLLYVYTCDTEKKTPKNRLNETLGPQNKKLESRPYQSLSNPFSLSATAQQAVLNLHKMQEPNGTIHITLLLQLSVAKNFCTLHDMLTVLYTDTLESRELRL